MDAISPLTPKAFQAAMAELGGVNDATLARLEAYADLLVKWQGAINLVGADTLGDLWRRHFLDSAQLVGRIDRGATVLDMGSGAGFPGLVLAIMGIGEVHLVESDQRKCTFLSTVNREVGAGVIIHNERLEKMAPINADVVVARALAPLEKLISLAVPHRISTGKCLFLKGKQWKAELTAAAKVWKMRTDVWPSVTDPMAAVLEIDELSSIKTKG